MTMGRQQDDTGATPDFGSALRDFRGALHAAWATPEAEREVVDAFDQYAAVLRQATEAAEVVERAANAYAEYERRVQDAFATPDAAQQVFEAFATYVAGIRAAWDQVDPSAVLPADLMSISEGMSWVSSVTAAVGRAAGKAY